MTPRKFYLYVEVGGHTAKLTVEWAPKRGTILSYDADAMAEEAADECFMAASHKVRAIALAMNGRGK